MLGTFRVYGVKRSKNGIPWVCQCAATANYALKSSPRYVLPCDARWSPYGLPGKCEVKNAGSVRTFERYSPIPYMFFVPQRTERHTPRLFLYTVCFHPPPLFLGNALFPWKLRFALSVARVNPGGFSSTMSNYIFTSSLNKLSPLVFCPLGRGQGDTIEKQEKRILLS